jgi:SAM-dependent methyltransferase
VLFAQTLEHLYDPVLCLRNLYDALAPGGYLFTSVPHLNHQHMGMTFFSMPTPMGLGVWATSAGFEVLKIGVFGNEQYIHNLAVHVTWSELRPLFSPEVE